MEGTIQLPEMVPSMGWGGLTVSPLPLRFGTRRPTLEEIEGTTTNEVEIDDYDTKWEDYGED